MATGRVPCFNLRSPYISSLNFDSVAISRSVGIECSGESNLTFEPSAPPSSFVSVRHYREVIER